MDLVIRYGGEEFVILLPETGVVNSWSVAERLRQDVGSLQVPTKWGDLSVTVSIGVAELAPGMVDLPTLIDRANQAEHTAKDRGKNCTVMSEGN